MDFKYHYFLFILIIGGCKQNKQDHETITEPYKVTDSISYHDIDFYTPDYGKYPALDSANDLMHDGFYSEAIIQYNRAEKSMGFHPDIYINRGFCFSRQKNYFEAISNNTTLIQHDSLYYPAFINRGMNYLDSGLFGLSLSDFQYSIKLAPERPESYVNAGLVFVELELKDSACYYFRKAKTIDSLEEYEQIELHIRNNCTEYNGLLEEPEY